MIEDFPYDYDMGRPTFFDEEARMFYMAVFEYIERFPLPMLRNDAYDFVREHVVTEGGGYGGGGFAFKFWFKTEEDMVQFRQGLDELCAELKRSRPRPQQGTEDTMG